MSKKIIDLNDKENILGISNDINKFNLSKNIIKPLKNAINILSNWEQKHDLTIHQINTIYNRLNINTNMTPEEMNNKLRLLNLENVIILEKKYFKSHLSKKKFRSTIDKILKLFDSTLSPNVIHAISNIVQNFSLICSYMDKEFLYNEVCFKFFTKCIHTNEILVLVLNISYEQKETKINILDIFKCKNKKISLSFLGALIKTDIPENN